MERLNIWGASDLEHRLSCRVADLLGTDGVPACLEPLWQWLCERRTGLRRPRITWLLPGQRYTGDATMDWLLCSFARARRSDASWERLSLVRFILRHDDAAQRVVTVPEEPNLSASLTDLLVKVAGVVLEGCPAVAQT